LAAGANAPSERPARESADARLLPRDRSQVAIYVRNSRPNVIQRTDPRSRKPVRPPQTSIHRQRRDLDRSVLHLPHDRRPQVVALRAILDRLRRELVAFLVELHELAVDDRTVAGLCALQRARLRMLVRFRHDILLRRAAGIHQRNILPGLRRQRQREQRSENCKPDLLHHSSLCTTSVSRASVNAASDISTSRTAMSKNIFVVTRLTAIAISHAMTT